MGTSTIHFSCNGKKVCDKTGFINATKMLFYIRKNGVTKTDYSVNSMLNYILFARALSSQMSAISIARNNPFFSLDLTSCFLGER